MEAIIECPECGQKFELTEETIPCIVTCDRQIIHSWHSPPERDCYLCNREDNKICPNCKYEF